MNRKEFLRFEERQKIEEMIKNFYTYSAIARELKRSDMAIGMEVKKNGGKIKYNAQMAQKNSESRRKEGYKKSGAKRSKQKEEIKSTSERIKFIEMQIDILCDQVRELMKK